jgi:UDP-N-acetyl-D-galactosamine dehydrogenase
MQIKDCTIFIITVPTPVTKDKQPDLNLLLTASKMVGGVIKKGDIIIYESTVYPGCTEEDCVPILEEFSSLKYNQDFYCGYSPERINPGDKVHTLTKIIKVTSGSTAEVATIVDNLYASIITAGTHKAPSIKVAEASKSIENAQRDINISFVNELALIFDKMDIDTHEVLAAAATKWNFLPFKPGLVGGHCIGVDPYYLTYKAESIGYYPKIILAGRELNDNMGNYVASKLVKKMKTKNIQIKGARILILGLTFKENCPDLRNSGVRNIIVKLKEFECKLDLQDPYADSKEIYKMYGIYPNLKLSQNTYDAVLIAVAHKQFKRMGFSNIKNLCKKTNVIYDFKNLFDSN